MFELEQAIRKWKKDLAKNQALEDTYVSELEAVLRDEVADRVRRGETMEEAFRLASSAMGESQEIGSEFSKVRRLQGRGQKLRRLIVPDLLWNYVRVALRKMRRQKGYSAVTISGLAVGLACCVLMMLWVKDELSFDRFHENGDSIYRLVTETRSETAATLDARAPTPLGPAVKAEFPEVLDICRYRTNNTYGIKLADKAIFDASIGIADPSFFSMFTFPFLKGDPKTALQGPRSVVITESLARTFFGDEDPMGKLLTITRDPYTVTGVIRDVPRNSHLRFACVIPIVNMHEYHHVNFENWNSMFFYCYVRLAPQAVPSAAVAKMSGLVAKSLNKPNVALRIQPLKDVHLRSDFAFDFDNYAQGRASTLTLFSIAAAAILLLACINFMNLATARSANRGKEVGLRKVTGARRSDIIRQFLGESFVQSFLGLILALLLIWALLPPFNALAGKQLVFARLFDPGLLAAILGVTLLAGLLAGSYPAFYLAGFEPVWVLKGTFMGGERGQAVLRKSLVVLQFTLTVFFVIGTIIVDKQLKFIRTKNLGLDTHQVVATVLRSEAHRDAIRADSRILSATQSVPPGQALRAAFEVTWEGKNPADRTPFFPLKVDHNYLETFRIGMAEGRFFNEKMTSDRTDAVVVNETAARAMGTGSPVGKRMTVTGPNHQGMAETKTYSVIGVMRDFHQSSLHQAIEPMVFTCDGDQMPWFLLRISPGGIAETMKFLEKTWKAFVPDYPSDFWFLDDRINAFYQEDRRTRSILGVFTVLALFTACLGLVGLASFIAERRTKEIGIRKVLGASTRGLVLMQSREFLAWVLVANAVAWPAAYFAAGKWLEGFAYRVRPGIEPAVLAAAFSLLLAFLSVGYKAVRAARANPVETLRYE
ncbi:MAG: ABC transporter permease [Candidatus Aminicenantes bacterium]|nr:ABC transporter permease [Candidatus Aminicenantes bacterium]